MNNLEWVRTLPAKELAKLLGDDCYMCSKSKGNCDMNCESGYVTWLNQEHIPKLKPCPVCKGEMEIRWQHSGCYLVCEDCGLHYGLDADMADEGIVVGGYRKEEALIEDWNRRVDNE